MPFVWLPPYTACPSEPHNDGMIDDQPAARPARKYLVVDDHAVFRQVIRDFLPGASVEVIECRDGAEALRVYAEHLPDWTLMDVEMPDMDGFTATRQILRHFSGARVVILTQCDSPEYREEALAAGACAFICKDDLSHLHSILQPPPAPLRAAV